MSCEVWVSKDIFICGTSLRSKSELKSQIEECRESIQNVKEKLRSLVMMTDPQKFFPNEDDIMFRLNNDFDELMDEYDSAQIKLTLLQEFEDSWNTTHDEKDRAILPLNPLDLKRNSYMGGDYVNYILEDGTEVPDDYFDVYGGYINIENYSLYNKIKNNK